MEENDQILIDTTDRISQLPEFIIHHILSFLESPTDLVRMGVLSNNWFDLTASFPMLNFNIRRIERCIRESGIPYELWNVRERFFDYVIFTTGKFCMHDVSAHTLKLVTALENPREVYIINRCLGFILRKGVKVLDIYIETSYLDPRPVFRLPNVLLSVSLLTSLTLRNCALPLSCMIKDVKFKFLKFLELERVPLHETVIKYLTTSCLFLEEINLKHCSGYRRFCVYQHQNLQIICIDYQHVLERIDIEAPNLSCLSLVDWGERGAPCMNLALCKKLTTVSYYGHPCPKSNGFNDFLSNFPFIENLFLTSLGKYNSLKLASPSLKALVLHSHCDLGNIDIDTPNLVLFTHALSNRKPYPWVKHSTQLKAHIECHPERNVNALWFLQLRRFLDKNNGFKVLKMHISACYINVEELKVTQSLPYELEHVVLEPHNIQELSVYLAVVEAVLWCCRPRSLTLRSWFHYIDFEQRDHVVNFANEKLLQQEDEGQANIQIVLSPSFEAQKHYSDKFSYFIATSNVPTVTFTKKEVVQEESMIMK